MASGTYARLDEPGHSDWTWDFGSRAHIFQLLALERGFGISLDRQTS